MSDLWHALSPTTQDALWVAILLLPALIAGTLVLWGVQPLGLVRAMIWRFRWANALFVLLIAVSVGIGIGLLAQERGLRRGTAQAADKFDLVIAAPGSELTMLLAAVYLQPSDVPLLDGETYTRVADHEHVALAAPLAFGDSFGDAPVIGTTPQFVLHLTEGALTGAMFAASDEAVAGAAVPLSIGDSFTPAHGHGDAADAGAHQSVSIKVVGTMPPTGTPWDKAILVPVESVWEVHGLANGHAPAAGAQIGPPFDAAYFPGTPAIIVHSEELWANYALRSEFTRDGETMAFFPGAVLVQLYRVMGDVRQAMSVMALTTQALVAASVLAGLLILIRLFRRQLALLRAIGAPGRFVFATVWLYAALLLVVGAALGVVLGQGATMVLSRILTARTNILIQAPLGWPEIQFVAGFVTLATLLALLPAAAMLRQPILPSLRS